MLQIGVHDMLINDVSFKEAGTGTPGVVVHGTIGDDDAFPTIWITENSAGIARRKLKLCGFDCDAHGEDPMGFLRDNPAVLRGNKVKVLVEDRDGRMNVDIMLNATPEDSKLKTVSGWLKASKKAVAPGTDTSGAPF